MSITGKTHPLAWIGKIGLRLIAAFFVLIAGAAAPVIAEQPIVGLPWTSMPDVASFFPNRALRMEVGGWTNVRCVAEISGQTSDCIAVGEYPSGFGFGHSAVNIARRAQVATTWRGQLTAGQHFVNKIVFAGPAPDSRATWLQEPSPQAIAAQHPGGADLFGMADIACGSVSAGGDLDQCKVSSESPLDQGFGAAALALAKDYRLKTVKPKRLRVALYIKWNELPATSIPPGVQIEPITNIYFGDQSPQTVSEATAFSMTPTQLQLDAAKPPGLVKPEVVSLSCDVSDAAKLINCKPDSQSNALPSDVLESAQLLTAFYRISPKIISVFNVQPLATYHVNWQP